MTTAAGLILGDEILSGKVRDVNSPLLIETLRDAGVQLVRLVVLGDDLERIAAEVASCAAAFDRVITSGGVGPTHDDCTIAARKRRFPSRWNLFCGGTTTGFFFMSVFMGPPPRIFDLGFLIFDLGTQFVI